MVSICSRRDLYSLANFDCDTLDPVREALMTSSTVEILLGLIDSRITPLKSSTPIYLVGSWAIAPLEKKKEWEKRIQMGSSIMTWAINILEDLLSGGK